MIAHLQAQSLSNANFHTHRIFFVFLPLPFHHCIVFRLGCAGRQIEFTIDQSFGTLVGVVERADFSAVDRHQAPSNHGIPVVIFHTHLLQRVLKSLSLIGLNIDHKTIRCIDRCGLAPTADQIGSEQHQQDQGQQTNRQSTHLHHGINRPRHDLPRGQQQPTRRGVTGHPLAQQLQNQPSSARKHQGGYCKTTDRHQTQFDITAGPHQGTREAQ